MKKLLIIPLAIAALVLGLAACGSSSQSPSCKPHSQHCRQASGGNWIPFWYYLALQRAQRTTRPPSVSGKQPSQSQMRSSGATESEAQSAEEEVSPVHESAPAEESAPVHESAPVEEAPHVSVEP